MGLEPRRRVLIVDDQMAMAAMAAEGLEERGFEAIAVDDPNEAIQFLSANGVDAVVTDLRMNGSSGLDVLRASRRSDPARPVVVMTAYGAIDTAVESMRFGAYHYLTKPFRMEELVIVLQRALSEADLRAEARTLRRAVLHQFDRANIIGRSKAIEQLLDTVERLTSVDAPVLLLGETGTGKSLIAGVLHGRSPRAAGPFVTVNCAALPEPLLESELFGHVKGAFTGAVSNRDGLFAEAEGGTLFLDEIGELTPALQAKMLDVLERRCVRPVGGNREREVDVRLVAATNRELRARVREGAFREDLLYRLDVVSVTVPPLRERREDIPLLVEHFLTLAKRQHPGRAVEGISAEAMAKLTEYDWPGNVRELAHVVERVVILGHAGLLQTTSLPPAVQGTAPQSPTFFKGEIMPIRDLERRYAHWVLERMGGNKTRTAAALQIDFKTLIRWTDDRGSQ